MSRLTKQQIENIVAERKDPPCKEWYKSNLTAKSYCETASREILKATAQTGRLPDIKQDDKCTYSPGERVSVRDTLKDSLGDMTKLQRYIEKTNRREERMCHCMFAQRYIGDYEVIDYQVPTTNSGHDKIDLVLKKGDTVYVAETKYFGSTETLLRCVLEIQTYYQKLNANFYKEYACSAGNVKKAVLISNDTLAYKQLEEEWAKNLLNTFDVAALILSRNNEAFYITKHKK